MGGQGDDALLSLFSLVTALANSSPVRRATRAWARRNAVVPDQRESAGYWFPTRERGLATAIFDAAAKYATAVGVRSSR